MTHHYLVDTSTVIPGAAVSTLQFNIMKEEPFTVQDLEVGNLKQQLQSKECTYTSKLFAYKLQLIFSF